MLLGAGTKMLFSLKMLDGAGIKKAHLSPYVRLCWHEKAVSTENTRRGCYKRLLKLKHERALSTRQGWYRKR